MQRATKACYHCRSKKRRCDTALPSCTPCVRDQLECTYPASLKRRGPGKTKKRLDDMEERLSQMSSLLRNSAVPSEPLKSTSAEQPQTLPRDTAVGEEATCHQPFGQISSLLTKAKMVGRNNLLELDDSQTVSFELMPAMVGLVMKTFPDMIQEIPVLDFEDFGLHASRVSLEPSSIRTADIPFFATRCSAMAITALGKIANPSFADMVHTGWSAFKRAHRLLPQLLLGILGLYTVQAMTLMGYFAGFSADTKLASFLLSNAMKSCDLLKASLRNTSLPLVSSAYFSRTSWAVFIMDTELSLHRDQIPSRSARDLERLDLLESAGAASSGFGELIFRKRAELSLILSTIREELYSQSPPLSSVDLQASIRCHDAKLREWAHGLPVRFWDDCFKVSSGDFEDMPGMMLKLTFRNAMSMVHWTARRIGTERPSMLPSGNTADWSRLSRTSHCAMHARDILRLLEQRPPVQFSYFWRSLCFGMSAALTLLAYIIEQPTNPLNTMDTELLRSFSRQVAAEDKTGDYDLSNLVTTCNAILDIAEKAINSEMTAETGSNTSDVGAIRHAFRFVAHPMFVVQDMLTNMRTRDAPHSRTISQILRVSFSADGYSTLVPDCVKPESFLGASM